MRAMLRPRIRLAWNTARFFLRRFLEYAATIWLLGIAPFLAHFAAARPDRGYAWIPNDLYLFVMVIAGNVAIEAFKDRESDGPSRPLAAILGVALAVSAAWAFGSLEAQTAQFGTALRSWVYRVLIVTLSIDFVYRVRPMFGSAVIEASEKEL